MPFWDRGAAALLVVAVAFTRLHDYGACCDAGGQEERLAYNPSLLAVCRAKRDTLLLIQPPDYLQTHRTSHQARKKQQQKIAARIPTRCDYFIS